MKYLKLAFGLALFALCIVAQWPRSHYTFPVVHAQQLTTQTADCSLSITPVLVAVGTSRLFDNRSAGCTDWVLTYWSHGVTTGSITIADAQNVGAAPGATVSWQGGTAAGVFGVGITLPVAISSSSTVAVSGYYPFMGVAVTAMSATSAPIAVGGTLQGWKRHPRISLTNP